MGVVVIGCCCKEVYRYLHNYYFSVLYILVLALFGNNICSFFKCFVVLVYVIFVPCYN